MPDERLDLLWADPFWAALERAATAMTDRAEMLRETEPTAPEGLNAARINELAKDCDAIRPVFEFDDVFDGGYRAERWIIFNHPGPADPIRILFWSRTVPILPPMLKVQRAINHLRLWRDFRREQMFGKPTAEPIGAPGPTVASPTAIKRPSEEAIMAWRVRDAGITPQTAIAEKMSKQLSRRITQGQVSRWINEVGDYMKRGNSLPDLSAKIEKPHPIDSAAIDMGERQDGLTPRQRERRDPDAD